MTSPSLLYNITSPFENSNYSGVLENSLQIDSGLLESGKHFGINEPRKDQIFYRRIETCAPLKPTKFMFDNTASNSTALNEGEEFFEIQTYAPEDILGELDADITWIYAKSHIKEHSVLRPGPEYGKKSRPCPLNRDDKQGYCDRFFIGYALQHQMCEPSSGLCTELVSAT